MHNNALIKTELSTPRLIKVTFTPAIPLTKPVSCGFSPNSDWNVILSVNCCKLCLWWWWKWWGGDFWSVSKQFLCKKPRGLDWKICLFVQNKGEKKHVFSICIKKTTTCRYYLSNRKTNQKSLRGWSEACFLWHAEIILDLLIFK